MNHSLKMVALVVFSLQLVFTSHSAPKKIYWWHAMGGVLGKKVDELASGFNKSQKEFEVEAIYKGSYSETMTGAIAAFRARKHPHIVQVFEVGTATMMTAKRAIYPVYQLMQDAGEKFDSDEFIAAVKGYYTDEKGNMISLPFNSSTPVVYYNKEAFRLAGLNPELGPRTWEEMEAFSKKLQKVGYPCGFTSGWQSWIQVENFLAWHNQPMATMSNGFEGTDISLLLENPLLKKHLKNLKRWQGEKIFDYGGRADQAAPKFFTGQCAMYMQSSAGYSAIQANVKTFLFGVSNLPYYSGTSGAPQNSIIGGASLWVLKGHKPAEYKGVAKFFSYLSQAGIQADWHQSTGYLPITKSAYKLTKSSGFYERNPGTETAISQLTNKAPTKNSKGLRLGNFVQIRDALNEEMEGIWGGSRTVDSAIQRVSARSKVLLKKFHRQASR